MRLLSYECPEEQADEKTKWITDELGYTVFKVQKAFGFDDASSNFYHGIYRSVVIVFIVMNDEEATALFLRHPPDTFRRV